MDSNSFVRLWIGLFLGARGVRIFQMFAGICRAILLKYFRIISWLATHNPQVCGSSPRTATSNHLRVVGL